VRAAEVIQTRQSLGCDSCELDWMTGASSNPPVYTSIVQKSSTTYDCVYNVYYPYHVGTCVYCELPFQTLPSPHLI
jgi:hypothetical protein